MHELTPAQIEQSQAPLHSTTFLSGPASCGKSTTGVERLLFLLQNNIPGESILLLAPQRTLLDPYLDLLRQPDLPSGSNTSPITIGGLSRRMVDLFWPLAAQVAGFAQPGLPPTFLTLETSQYYMAGIVRPLMDQGAFGSLTIDRNRLYSQILDNLNKAAAIGFPHTEIGSRLSTAFVGEPAQRHIYADAQQAASLFRQHCLTHNLLDFSLQLEIFWEFLWPHPIVHDYLIRTYRHIIYDNVEEDIPRAHDFIQACLPHFDSALLIYDEDGGFRRFLGADIESGLALSDLCSNQERFATSFVTSPGIATLGENLACTIAPSAVFQPVPVPTLPADSSSPPIRVLQARFYPQLLDLVTNLCAEKVASGLPCSEIVILAPYLSDALRFSITSRLQALNLPWRTHRPSRSLHDEPATRALLTLASLAHPQWNSRPPAFDVAYALMQSILNLDLVRAQLLVEGTYHPHTGVLDPFALVTSQNQERITFLLGERFSILQAWLLSYQQQEPLPLDHFLRKLFGEVLSQLGFGFHRDFDAVRVASSLIESIRKFRLALTDLALPDMGREYLAMLNDGIIAAQYLENWQVGQNEAILVAPAHTFLMMNVPVSLQFWLDPGSSGWYERLSQPLTHPYVLSRTWTHQQPGRVWTDADEVTANRSAMARLTLGLTRHCRSQIILAIPELGESGFEGRGHLLKALQQGLALTGEGS